MGTAGQVIVTFSQQTHSTRTEKEHLASLKADASGGGGALRTSSGSEGSSKVCQCAASVCTSCGCLHKQVYMD